MFFVLLTVMFVFYVSAAILFVEGLTLYGGVLLVLGIACMITLVIYYRRRKRRKKKNNFLDDSWSECKRGKRKIKSDDEESGDADADDSDCGEFDCDGFDCCN
jgi:hypothetical protein